MPERLLEHALDPSCFPDPVSQSLIDQWITPGDVDHDMRLNERRVITKGFACPEDSSGNGYSEVSAFFINTAGTHARLWRAAHSPTLFVSHIPKIYATEVKDILMENEKNKDIDYWQNLNTLITDMFVWSLEEEVYRLLTQAQKAPPGSPSATILKPLSKLAQGNVMDFNKRSIVEYFSKDLRSSISAASITIAGLMKVIPALVEENGVDQEELAAASTLVAQNSYRTIALLLQANPSLTSLFPEIFEDVLQQDVSIGKELFQLAMAPDGSGYTTISQAFIDRVVTMLQTGDYGELAQTRGVCPAGRIVGPNPHLPPEWSNLKLRPYVKDMWDTAFETAEILYRKMYS